MIIFKFNKFGWFEPQLCRIQQNHQNYTLCKGQIRSEWIYEIINFPKNLERPKIFWELYKDEA